MTTHNWIARVDGSDYGLKCTWCGVEYYVSSCLVCSRGPYDHSRDGRCCYAPAVFTVNVACGDERDSYPQLVS